MDNNHLHITQKPRSNPARFDQSLRQRLQGKLVCVCDCVCDCVLIRAESRGAFACPLRCMGLRGREPCSRPSIKMHENSAV